MNGADELVAAFEGRQDGLFLTLHGSRLYGVANAESDVDAKGVFMPTSQQLLLGRRDALNPVEVKREESEVTLHAVQHFAQMLLKGDTNAVDVLFAAQDPRSLLAVTPAGESFLAALDPTRVVSRNLGGMLGFVRAQARKYSRKGDRVLVWRALQGRLEGARGRTHEAFGWSEDPADWPDAAVRLRAALEAETGVRLAEEAFSYAEEEVRPGVVSRHVSVFGTSLDARAPVGHSLEVVRSQVKRYGHRAQQASRDQGRDLKAWYHAFRVAFEVKQLHEAGRLVFPSPEAAFLRQVREGVFELSELSVRLDAYLESAQRAEASSVLPERVDEDHLQEVVLGLYAEGVPVGM